MMAGNTFGDFWYGRLHVELRGVHVENVVSDLHRTGLVLRQLRMGRTRATLIVSLRDFDDLYQACRRHGVKLRFLERNGAPFWAKRLRRRKSMVVGPLLFLFIIFICSSIIWQVNVSGVNEDEALTLRQAASASGLYVGAWKWSLGSAQAVQDKLLRKVPDLIWVGVNFDGSKANVEAIEKIKGISPTSEAPHNIVAGKPAVIAHVFATRGQVLVKPGQVVHPGEVLISGNLGQGATQVPAAGKALAQVWYTTDVTVPLKLTHSGMTGLHYKQGYLMLGNWGIHLWGWKQPHYQTQVNTISQTDWVMGKFRLPVQWKTVTTYDVQKVALQKSEKTAKVAALQLANQDVRSKIGKDGTIQKQTVLHEEVSHGKLYEKVWTQVEEDIGVAKPIPETSDESDTSKSQ